MTQVWWGMTRCLEEDTRGSSYVVVIGVTRTLTSFWLIHFLNSNTGFREIVTTRSYLLPNLPNCSLKSYSTSTSNIESLFVHDTPSPMPTSQYMTYRVAPTMKLPRYTNIPKEWDTLWGKKWLVYSTRCLYHKSVVIHKCRIHTHCQLLTCLESWESRLRHRWLIFQQDSSVQRWNSAKLVYSHFWWNNVLLTKLRWLNIFYY